MPKRASFILAAIILGTTAPAAARPGMHTIRVEAGGALHVGDQFSRFGFGGGGGLGYELRPIDEVGIELRYHVFIWPVTQPFPGDASYGDAHGPGLAARIHPLPNLDLGDLWFDPGIRLMITGPVVRPALEIGVGFDFEVAVPLRIGPFVRFTHVFQPDDDGLGPADGSFLIFGISVSLLGEAVGDRDGDGIMDHDDECPDEPEDQDSFEDPNGCPDPDNDQDGILDDPDQCPLEAEDRDSFEDEDGCPDPDNDQDGILDDPDQCPLEPGVPEHQGCPAPARVQIDESEIHVLDRIEFEVDSEALLSQSEHVLGEVRTILAENPEIELVRIEGHTDDRHGHDHNLDLSQRRARAVVLWLVGHGVHPARLESWGCGENHPLESNQTQSGRQANRRVEFHILRPAPPQGARSLPSCDQIGHDEELSPRQRRRRRRRR